MVEILLGLALLTADPVRAFPGAEGAGAFVTGGRGGRILHVTTPADDYENPPPGSLRAALLETGPRIIVFDIGGTIVLAPGAWDAMLKSADGDFTIYGQTAPGGITIEGMPVQFADVSNFVVQNVRFRGVHNWQGSTDIHRSFTATHCGPFILDHCSFTGAGDETPHVSNCKTWTISNCIVAESALKGQGAACHPKGSHNFGLLCMTMDSGARGSLLRNLIAHHRRRLPRITVNRPGTVDCVYDLRNNVFYNAGQIFSQFYVNADTPQPKSIRYNILANAYLHGPTTDARYLIGVREQHELPTAAFYLPNVLSTPKERDLNLWYRSLESGAEPEPWNWPLDKIWQTEEVKWLDAADSDIVPATTYRADTAMQRVLNHAGAWPRDCTDRRTVQEVRERTGGHGLRGPYERFPEREGPCHEENDADRDGMADAWEQKHGGNLDPSDTVPSGIHAGYTNIEAFCAVLMARKVGQSGQTWTVQTSVSPEGAGIVNCDHARPPCGDLPPERGWIEFGTATVNHGSRMAAVAVARNGYQFSHWTVNGRWFSEQERVEGTIVGNVAAVAHFEEQP